MFCTDNEWKHCRVEKMTCIGCFFKEELWKDIKEYEGIYQVSNLGRIKSLKFMKEKILKPKKTSKGYLQVLLYKNGKRKYFRIHRLVAETFVPNPYNKPEVNHIDGDKENNKENNLEWTTIQENRKHAYKIGLRGDRESIRKMCIKNGKKACKAICQFDIKGNFIKEWESQTKASMHLNINRTSIGNCLKNRNQTAGGYVWKFKEEV